MTNRMGRLLLAAVCAAAGLHGQENVAAIIGRVADNTGSAVIDAEIRVLNSDTGVEARTVSNEVGNYIVPGLPPGRYKVTADRPGFKRVEVADVLLDLQQQKRVDVRLEVGEVHEVVSVVSTPPQLVTDDATLGQVVDSKPAVCNFISRLCCQCRLIDSNYCFIIGNGKIILTAYLVRFRNSHIGKRFIIAATALLIE